MPEELLRGKAVTAVARDIADGYMVLNPLVMKNFATETYRALFAQLRKVQMEVRTEKFPSHDVDLIRRRNLRLQRLYQAITVLQNMAKQKKILLA